MQDANDYIISLYACYMLNAFDDLAHILSLHIQGLRRLLLWHIHVYFMFCKSSITLILLPCLFLPFVSEEDRRKNRWMPVNEHGNRQTKKKTDGPRNKIVNEDWWWRLVREMYLLTSHSFPNPPSIASAQSSSITDQMYPQCVQLRCHFHPTLCSYLWCHWKMTKLEPQQNFLFHTPQAENCPLFTLLALFHPAVARL